MPLITLRTPTLVKLNTSWSSFPCSVTSTGPHEINQPSELHQGLSRISPSLSPHILLSSAGTYQAQLFQPSISSLNASSVWQNLTQSSKPRPNITFLLHSTPPNFDGPLELQILCLPARSHLTVTAQRSLIHLPIGLWVLGQGWCLIPVYIPISVPSDLKDAQRIM